MNPTRKFFLKLAAILFFVIVIQSIWKIAVPWKTGIWIACLAALVLGIIPLLGRPLHLLWLSYVKFTSEGMRFFQGMGLVGLTIAAYRFIYLEPGVGLRGFNLITMNGPHPDCLYWGTGGGVLLFLGLVPPAAKVVFGGWMKLAGLIQSVMSRVILFLAYCVAVLPVGLVAKLVGKKFLDKKLNAEAKSYWLDKEEVNFDPGRYEKHF